MKRKIVKPVNRNSGLAKLLRDKIDQHLSSIENNDVDLEKIAAELAKRELTMSQKKAISSEFSIHEKTANDLTNYMRKI